MFGLKGNSPSFGNNASLPAGRTAGQETLGNVSVHNRSLDLVTNDIPSVFVIPSSNDQINIDNGRNNNNLVEHDFVFALHPPKGSGIPNFKGPYERDGSKEVQLVSVSQLNQLICEAAINDIDKTNPNKWYADPFKVSVWASAFGVVLNTMTLSTVGASMNRSGTRRRGVNVAVSRRVNVKNNFFTLSRGHKSSGAESWHATSTQIVAIQYSMEELSISHAEEANKSVDIVLVSMLLLDDIPLLSSLADHGVDHVESRSDALCVSSSDTTARFEIKGNSLDHYRISPLRSGKEKRIVTPIGRVLHSPSRVPTAYDAVNSALNKHIYDRLALVEIELGCP